MNILFRKRKLGNGSCLGIQAASEQSFTVVRNDRELPYTQGYLFRWGCTSVVPDIYLVVNTAEAINWCSHKRQGRLDMQAAGVSVPETWTHEDFDRAGNTTEGGFNEWLSEGRFVSRTAQHAQGRNLLHGTSRELFLDARFASHAGGYVSRLIEKVAEYRVAVIQGRVAWVAKKTPGNPEDVAWNVARGGRFDNVRWDDWPMKVIDQALLAAKVSNTDFCGVDVMVDDDGRPYVLEVNSAPSQTSPYRQKCFAKCFDYILVNGKEHFPAPARLERWKHAVHPALWCRNG